MDAVTALANEFTPDILESNFLDSIVWDESTMLWPGSDWQDNKMWMTFPVSVRDERVVGRGKAAHTEAYNRLTTVLINTDGKTYEYEPKTLERLGYSFPPIYYHETENPRWSKADMRAYGKHPSSPAGRDIHAKLKAIYLEYVEYADPILYDLMPLWIMGTYVYRIFHAYGYIHFNGSASSGKSQNLALLKALAFNTSFTSSTSIAALFRSIAAQPGVLCLDEAENFRDDAGADLLKLLKQGYRRGSSVRRTEKLSPDSPYQPINFPVYAPKALASIATQDPVLTSRCLVINMVPSLRRIPEFNPDDPRWQNVRNDLYRWALYHASDVAQAEAEWNHTKRHTDAPKLIGRQWQVAQALYIIADAIGLGSLTPKLTDYLYNYYAASQRAQNDVDKLRLVVRSLPEVVRTKQPGYGSDYYSIRDIYEVVIAHLEDDTLDKFKTTSVARLLRPAGFNETKQTRGGLHFRITPENLKYRMEHLGIEPFDEDQGWQDATTTQPLRDPQLDWLDTYTEGADPSTQ